LITNINFLKDKLKEKGYKLNKQRKQIIEVINENKEKHLSIDEIFNYAKNMNSDIGIATVYRTLAMLVEIEYVVKMDFDDGVSRYEFNTNSDTHKHHHLICIKCGEIFGLEEDLLGNVEEYIFRKEGFLIKDHKVKFYGYCKRCNGSTKK